jgi:HEAT repeat protein
VYALQERNWKPENKDQAIKIHTTLLRSKDRTERQQALKFLVAEENFVPDEQLASYLLKLFHRGDVSEKSSVTHLLARTRASNYLSAYLKLLSQDNLDKSLESAVRLAIKKIPGKPLVRELRKRLLSGELEQRSTIAHLLQELGWEPRHPIETLIYNLSVHKYEQVRTLLQKKPALLVEYSSRFESEHIQELLEKIDLYYSPQLVNSLVKLSEHPDRIVRLKLVDIFKIHLREQGIEGLLYLLNNDDLKVRRASKHALLSPEVPASMVIDRLQRHRGSKRQKVILCDVLGEKRAEEAVLILMALASSKDFHIAKSAVTALGKIGDGRAVPILQKVLYQDGRIWKTILYALKNIGTQEALSVIAKYRKYR